MKKRRIDLREMKNSDCLRCNREERKGNVSNEVCTKIKSALDELSVRCVGEWSYEKIYRLVQYFGIFSRGMKKKWAGLNYIEICSGPGRCVTKNDCNEMDGTSLAIINHKVFPALKQAVFIDIDSEVVRTLNNRIESLGASEQAKAFVGDYNDKDGILKIINYLQTNCLNLIFVDPTECDVPFETISAIASYLKNADIIINIALGTDVNRNLVNATIDSTFSQAKLKYERFLGISGYCSRSDVIQLAQLARHAKLREHFIKAYCEQFASIGYHHTDIRRVRHYYELLFASRSPTGLKFWLKANEIEPDNQRRLL